MKQATDNPCDVNMCDENKAKAKKKDSLSNSRIKSAL